MIAHEARIENSADHESASIAAEDAWIGGCYRRSNQGSRHQALWWVPKAAGNFEQAVHFYG